MRVLGERVNVWVLGEGVDMKEQQEATDNNHIPSSLPHVSPEHKQSYDLPIHKRSHQSASRLKYVVCITFNGIYSSTMKVYGLILCTQHTGGQTSDTTQRELPGLTSHTFSYSPPNSPVQPTQLNSSIQPVK